MKKTDTKLSRFTMKGEKYIYMKKIKEKGEELREGGKS